MPTLRVLSFWRFAQPPLLARECEKLQHALLQQWRPLGVHGRIYVAEEGINAQLSVPASQLIPLVRSVRQEPFLSSVYLNLESTLYYDASLSHFFPRLTIKQRNEIISSTREEIPPEAALRNLDLHDAGEELPPSVWHEKMQAHQQDPSRRAVLDCRNQYEQLMGQFDSSQPLSVTTYAESFPLLRQMKDELMGKEEVLLYCTGGVRCVKIGAYLKQELGVSRVGMLHGGINSYARYVAQTKQPSTFQGTNFVFDGRMGVTVSEDESSDSATLCIRCRSPSTSQQNCSNPCCNRLIILCSNCQQIYHGTCSTACETYHQVDQDQQRSLRQQCGQRIEQRKVEGKPFNFRQDRHPIYLEVLRGWNPSRSNSRAYSTRVQHAMDHVSRQDSLHEYARRHSFALPSEVERIAQRTREELPHLAHNVCGPDVLQFLGFLIRTRGYHSILELGTFTGYSAIGMASACCPSREGVVHTCETNEEHARLARGHIEQFHQSQSSESSSVCVQLHEKSAMDFLHEAQATGQRFDFIFVDANKKQYVEYYDYILEHQLLDMNGTMVFDNTLFRGAVLPLSEVQQDDAPPLAPHTQKLADRIHQFNEHVLHDSRTHQFLLPLRDGLTIIHWAQPSVCNKPKH